MEKSFSLIEWCEHRRVSRSMYYKLRDQGLAPRVHRVGDKVLVSPDADREWLAEREAAAQVEAAA
jgi:hypothetical protein